MIISGASYQRISVDPHLTAPSLGIHHIKGHVAVLHCTHSLTSCILTMPSAPGVSAEEAKKLKDAKSKKDNEARKRRDAKTKYLEKAKTDTVEELVGVADLEKEYFKEGEWVPAWGHVEFVSQLQHWVKLRCRMGMLV